MADFKSSQGYKNAQCEKCFIFLRNFKKRTCRFKISLLLDCYWTKSAFVYCIFRWYFRAHKTESFDFATWLRDMAVESGGY